LRTAGYPNRSFKVDVVKDDKVIDTQELVPDTNGTARISVRVKADSGEHRYVFRVPPEPDESETLNNERAVFLRSVGEKVRVLVAKASRTGTRSSSCNRSSAIRMWR
jgi:hypothetical protein